MVIIYFGLVGVDRVVLNRVVEYSDTKADLTFIKSLAENLVFDLSFIDI